MRGKDGRSVALAYGHRITPHVRGKDPILHLRQCLQVRPIMPGISSISVSSAHDGHQPKAVGLAASHALTQQCPELL